MGQRIMTSAAGGALAGRHGGAPVQGLGRTRAPGALRRGLVGLIWLWRHRQRDRQSLTRLDPHLLRDIGLTPQDASTEAQKPFWRA